MKIYAQNFRNIKLSLIIKSKSLSNNEISELTGLIPNKEVKDYWQFDENKTLRSFPCSEDFEIDMFVSDYLQQEQETWNTLKEKSEITLLIKAEDNFDRRSIDEDIKFKSEVLISTDSLSELARRNINLKIDQSFLMIFHNFSF